MAHGTDREVAREQGSEEHQLAGQPHDRADAHHARPVVMAVQTGGRDRSCCRHGAIMSCGAGMASMTPRWFSAQAQYSGRVLVSGAVPTAYQTLQEGLRGLPPFGLSRVLTQ